MNINADEFDDDMVAEVDVTALVGLANVHVDAMHGMDQREAWQYVKQIVTGNDFVFALWRDTAKPGSVGVLMVKGVHRMFQDIANDVASQGDLTAIPCANREQAVFLKSKLGDKLDS
jgi:hypothetical protein